MSKGELGLPTLRDRLLLLRGVPFSLPLFRAADVGVRRVAPCPSTGDEAALGDVTCGNGVDTPSDCEGSGDDVAIASSLSMMTIC